MKNIIVAYDLNRAIGFQNKLPWQGRLPADMKYFRELTTHNAVIMGRKTFESIGHPLPNRENIVLSRKTLNIPGVTVCDEFDYAYNLASDYEEIFVIGGAEIFKLALESVDRIYVTEIDTRVEADTFFPRLSDLVWKETKRDTHKPDSQNAFGYSFVIYDRI